jgi:hypothetical protein
MSKYYVGVLFILLPSLLISACGGDSVSRVASPVAVDSNNENPSPSLSIASASEVASGAINTLRAEPGAGSQSGSWHWQFDRSQLSDDDVTVSRDRLTYRAPEADQPIELNFSLERHLDGQEAQAATKLVVVYPAGDERKRPFVDAGVDLNTDEGAVLTLGVVTSAQGGRSIRSIQWQQQSGPSVDIIGAADQDTLKIQLPQTDSTLTFVFRVSAKDSAGFIGFDDIKITVFDTIVNALPVVDAGVDIGVDANTVVALTGSASDGDGEISRVRWQALAPYDHLIIDMADTLTPSLRTPNVSEDSALEIRLTATDDKNGSSSDSVFISVRAVVNTAPEIAEAYVDPGVAYSGESVALVASAQDVDGNNLSYHWRQLVEAERPLISITQGVNGRASAILPSFSDPYIFKLELAVSDGRETVRREVSFQGVATQKPQANLVSCLSAPFQLGCPLSPLAPVLNPDSFSACAIDPTSSECIFTKIAGPAVLACIDTPSPETCGKAFASLADPSYVLEQLGEEDSAGSCNPAFDGRSYEHYIGALHEHTAYSDGTYFTRPADVFARVKAKDLDFAGSSDHSDNIGLPLTTGRGDCPPERILDCLIFVDANNRGDAFVKWRATQEQALAASDDQFTAFRGFEWTSDRFGHANVFFSRNIINAKTGPGYLLTMARFWEWFSYPAQFGGGSDGLISFNHPGREDAIESIAENLGGDPGFAFNDFRYVKAADFRTVGIEVFGKGSEYDSDGPAGSWLSYALDKGWYLAPVGSEDHHDTRWGDADLPKTVLIARSRHRDDLREAMLARRFYAVAQNYNTLRLDYSIDGQPMGSRLRRVLASELAVSITLNINSSDVSAPRFELVGPRNTVLASSTGTEWRMNLKYSSDLKYAFIRVFDGERPVAVSAPIWIQEGEKALPICEVPEVWKDQPALLPSL